MGNFRTGHFVYRSSSSLKKYLFVCVTEKLLYRLEISIRLHRSVSGFSTTSIQKCCHNDKKIRELNNRTFVFTERKVISQACTLLCILGYSEQDSLTKSCQIILLRVYSSVGSRNLLEGKRPFQARAGPRKNHPDPQHWIRQVLGSDPGQSQTQKKSSQIYNAGSDRFKGTVRLCLWISLRVVSLDRP